MIAIASTVCSRVLPGPDGMIGSAIIAGISQFVNILSDLIDVSFSSGEFLLELWKSRGVGIYKGKGDRQDPDSYRLVCVQNILTKG